MNTPTPLPSSFTPSHRKEEVLLCRTCATPSHETTFLRDSLLEMCWYTRTACFYAHHRCHPDLCCLL